ncbi:unnamed protein product, partial [Prorocentrum cordatum]
DGDGAAANGAGAGGSGTGDTAQGGKDVAATEADINSEHRRKGLQFAESAFLPHLDCMRIIMVPIMQMFRAFDELGGDAWEERQRFLEADALRRGVSLDVAGNVRTYRMVVCAEGTIEKEFFTKLKFLCTDGLAAALAADKDCLADDFWKDFKRDNPDLSSPIAVARLALLALMAIPSIVRIEALHGSIRQILRVMSFTNVASFLEASAAFLQKRLRARERKLPLVRECWIPNARIHKPDSFEPTQKKRRGGGGAWRAFVSMSDKGFYRDFAALAERYRNMTEGQRAEDIDGSDSASLCTLAGAVATRSETWSEGEKLARQAKQALSCRSSFQ